MECMGPVPSQVLSQLSHDQRESQTRGIGFA